MDLDTLIVTVFCLVDDALAVELAGRRPRRRGPQPVLYDAEVLTMEVVGESLGLDQEKALFAYFRRHHSHLFPVLGRVHRTTFTRQAANLWQVKARLWQHSLSGLARDRQLSLADSFSLPVCRFARAQALAAAAGRHAPPGRDGDRATGRALPCPAGVGARRLALLLAAAAQGARSYAVRRAMPAA